MEHLVLHHTTKAQLSQLIANPAHAVLLTGPAGTGKTAIAETVATQLLGMEPSKHPNYLVVSPEGLSISIEAIRQLQKFLQLKTIGDRPIRRIVLVEHAHTLTTEAQNAFLKLLEEPPADTLVIMTAHSPRGLLPTILSRAQTIAVTPPENHQLQDLLLGSQKDAETQKQALFLSGGLPGLLHALLYEEDHPLLSSIMQAKTILQKPVFERLALVDTLSKQKEAALGVVDALGRIAQAGLAGSAAKQDTTRIRQWHAVRTSSLAAAKALQQSANAKLVLADLFLRLG